MAKHRSRLTRIHVALALMAVTSAVPFASDRDVDRVPIFLKSAVAVDGFTDPSRGRLGSVNEVRQKLWNSRVLRPVQAEGEALVVIEVLGRQTRDAIEQGWTIYQKINYGPFDGG